MLSPTRPSVPPAANEEDEDLGADVGELLDELPPLELDDDFEPDTLPDNSLALDPDEPDAARNEREPSELDVGDDSDDLSLPAADGGHDDTEGLEGTEADIVELSEGSSLSDADDGLEGAELPLPTLPGLDRGDDAEGVEDRALLPPLLSLADEERPPFSRQALVELSGTLALEACTALATTEDITVAASTDLFWFGRGELTPVRLEAGSSRIHAVALVGTDWEYAVCATANGRLLRRGRMAASSTELRRFRENDVALSGRSPAAQKPVASFRESVKLCQPGARFPHTLLLLSAGGRLLRSDDDGLSFARVNERQIVALSPGGPIFALASDGVLLRSDDGGGNFNELPLSELALEVSPLSPLLGGCGDGVALASASLGVLVSADGGAHFQRAAGTQGVTALCVTDAEGDGGPVVFAALHDDAHDRTLIVCIQCATGQAEVVYNLEVPSNDSEESELSRVSHLTWDARNNRLWAAGAFGVKVFVRFPGPH